MASNKSVSIDALPNEILDFIFEYFDTPSPVIREKLINEPSFNITTAPQADLKSISLVSKKWRTAVLPKLFKYVRLVIYEPKLPTPIFDTPHTLFNFVTKYRLKPIVESFTICVQDKDSEKIYPRFHHDLFDFSSFWNDVFHYIDPIQVTIVANPRVLGSLTNMPVHADDSWSFDMPYHMLQLRQDASTSINPPELQSTATTSSNGEASGAALNYPILFPAHPAESMGESGAVIRKSTLFEVRPWTSLLLNEGSFIKAYKTYEFFHRSPPSILPWLVGDSEIPAVPVISPTIRDFSYIAIFPISEYFCKLTHNFPRLDRLYVQLVPRNNILGEPENVEHLDTNDLWSERNTCYAFIMREIFSNPPMGNFFHLREFESGDAADMDAWHMAVEYVKRAGGGWKVEREGVFVKGPETPADGDDLDGPPQPMLFHGSLQRWAFAGIARLPVSALGMYFQA